MANNKHKIAAALSSYASEVQKKASEKSAAGEGAPDRMTAGDGEGGVSAEKGSRPHDVGEDEVKRDQPTDGTQMKATEIPSGSPDRMTAGDGEGGVDCKKDSRPDDPGEDEVKQDQPTDGEVRKAAAPLSKRAANLRAALMKASPSMKEKIEANVAETEKSAKNDEGADKQGKPEASKQAGASSSKGDEPAKLDLSENVLAKVASAVLSTEEGQRAVHDILEKQAGEEAARAQIQEAIVAADAHSAEEQVKAAAFDDLGQKVQAIDASLAQAGVTEEDADEIMKQAALHQDKINGFEHDMLKAAYVQGMDDAALMTAADEAGGEEGAPPVDEALPMGGEDLSEEEIMQLLQEMIASGEITEEDIMAAVAAEGGGEDPAAAGLPAEGGLPAEDPAAAAMAEEPAMV